jgi:phosphotransferase system enzyme I (PtsI)
MGWRSIRLSFEHPKLFQRQIRAILRAAADADKEVRLLFPMVTAYEEVQRIRTIVRRARRELDRVQLGGRNVPIGIMIEVPAAAIAVDTLLPDVDFVSIGSNDLVQYLTAADRDNPKVSHLCQPLNPGVLKVLSWIVEACSRAEKPVTICGEMAASPSAFPLLFGMGLRSFSMSAALLPSIKNLACRVTTDDTKRLLAKALRQRSARAVARLMEKWLDDIDPQLRLLETASTD